MELKNALTVCLISLFSATLVLLIARALDLQAAARLEPQLTRIVEELEGLRQQGGIAAPCPQAGRTRRSPRGWSCTTFTATLAAPPAAASSRKLTKWSSRISLRN